MTSREEEALPGTALRDQCADFSHYRYYKVLTGGAIDEAIRTLVTKDGCAAGAETISSRSGRFVNCTGRLSELGSSPYVDEVDEAEFDRIVAAQVAAVREAERKAREAGEPWPPRRVGMEEFLAARPADPNLVVLQMSMAGGAPRWIVDARLRDNGDLAFCSGGASGEWYLIVPASEVEALRSALEQGLESGATGTVLELVSARFSASEGAPNPFEEIKAFLSRFGIPWTFDHW